MQFSTLFSFHIKTIFVNQALSVLSTFPKIIVHYYMARKSRGRSEPSDCFLISRYFAIRNVPRKWSLALYFCLRKQAN